MVKSGGTTITHLIRSFSDRTNISLSKFANDKWLEGINGTRTAEIIFSAGEGIIYGAYAEGLRPVEGSGNCKWFTVFRHPVSRLVSAFFYCKYMDR